MPRSLVRSFLLTVGMAFTLVITAGPVDAQVVLRPKLVPGSTHDFKVESTTKQLLTINGMDVPTEATTYVISQRVVGKPQADGSLKATTTTKKLQQELNLPGYKLSFDSDNPDKKAPIPQLEPLLDALRASAKFARVVVYDKSGLPTKVEGADKALESLPKATRTLLANQLSNKALLKQAQNETRTITDKPKSPGESWTHDSKLNLEAGQLLTIKQKFTYVGPVKQGSTTLHKISVKALSATLTQDAPPGSPTQLSNAKLKVAKGAGEILVDLAEGAIAKQTGTTQLVGTLDLSIMGMTFPAKLDLTISITSTLGR